MKTERLALASGFAPASRQDWHKLVDDVLKGAPCAEISAHALQQVGARHIYLAGLPSLSEPAFRRAGICSFIHVSCDALATLNAAYNRIQNPKVSG